MSLFILDLFFALFFVLLLVLLLKIRERAFTDNKESYRYTASGILVLLLVSVLRLLNHQGLLATVPFFSEAIYEELAEAIGIITGVALMIAGISIWLPVKKKMKDDVSGKAGLYSAVQKIEHEILETNPVRYLFESVPRLINQSFDFASSALFRVERDSGRLVCTKLFGFTSQMPQDLKGCQIESGKPAAVIENAKKRYNAAYAIPLTVSNALRAIVLFWKDNVAESTLDEKTALERIGRIFSYRLTAEFTGIKQGFLYETLLYLRLIRNLIARRNDLRNILKDFYALFNQAVGSEYFSLAVLDKYKKNMRRYTVGKERKVLLEDGTCLPIENTHVGVALDSRKTVLVSDTTAPSTIEVDQLFSSCGQRSVMAIPILNRGRVISVLTLGHPRAGHFRHRDLIRAEIMATVMAPAVEAEISRRNIFERDRYMGALAAFDQIVESSTDIDSLIKSATDLLIENIGTTMVRISFLDGNRTNLITKSLKTIRPFDQVRVDKASISKEMTPWHYMVIQENRLLLINQNDLESSMDVVESGNLVFDGMKSALIVPIVVNGLTLGLITLGEMRKWERFTYQPPAIIFCKQVAARIANGIKLFQLSRAILKAGIKPEALSAEDRPEFDLRRELKSPVTRLKGSLDLLKIRGSAGEGDTGRIIAGMEESANRMIALLNEEQEKIPD
jgi:transcriptional regulator with GAF, ATPase, and Fis domain